jgi:hypothetical protein
MDVAPRADMGTVEAQDTSPKALLARASAALEETIEAVNTRKSTRAHWL